MPLMIVRQDITKMKVDAIVNAANTELRMEGGACGAIFKAAGERKMRAACAEAAPIRIGEAAITPGFRLPAEYVIHAAGPVYRGEDDEGCAALLHRAYTNSMKLALEHKCESIAFPLISGEVYGYPADKALKTAVDAVRAFLTDHEMDVYLAVYDKAAFKASRDLFGQVKSYIDEYYFIEHAERPLDIPGVYGSVASKDADLAASKAAGLSAIVGDLDEPFNETLLRLIDSKGLTDADVYKKANIDRKLFSKIRIGRGYTPGKKTILALCIALELDLYETDDLLERAGYALSHSQLFDVIVEYFIVNKEYDIDKINEVLFSYDQPLLGSMSR
ncbi:MAG: macro domain-containing protein [Anaerovoracaceae bacterium]|jgi:O-acetyl-ADP-ribose deacetylase (regulator of RNase III)